MNFPGPTERRAGLGFMLVFALLAAAILTAGCLYYQNYKRQFRAEAELELSAIADLKVDELVQYRKERLGNADTFYNNSAFSELVRRFLDQPADADTQRRLQSWLGRFQAYYGYARINLFDVQGAERLAVPDQPEPLPGHMARDIAAVLRFGQMTFLDFHRDAPGLPVQLEILVPIFDGSDTNRPLGVLVLRIDPEISLYPFIKLWPVPSKTAETLLVRRDGNDVLFLNELKFATNIALNRRISLENTNVPAVKAVLGQTGIVEGLDYRGVPVLAALQVVPDSPWFLVARQDVAEVFAPLRERLWQLIFTLGVLLFGSGAGVGLIWRQLHVRFYRAKYEMEAFRAKLGAIVESSEYAIISKNLDGIITSWNPSAERIYGYSAAEAVGKSIEILIPPGHPNESPQLIGKIKRGEAVEHYETERIRKNGERIQVSLSLSPVKDEAGAIVGVIGYDITERKRAEEALRESEERYHAMLEQAADAVFMHDETGRILDVNWKACQSLGYSREELLSKSIGDIDPEAIRAGKHELWDKILAGEHLTFESHQMCKDGSVIPVEVSLGSVRLPRGPVILGFARNITERKRAETELRRANRAMRMISLCNQEMVRATDEAALLQTICQIIIEHGGYRMVWVGFAEQDEARSVRPVAQAGFEKGYLDTVNITWADAERGRGPTGTAIRTGKPVLARNIPTDPAFAPWRAAAIQRGYASSIAMPLHGGGRCFGALMIYATEPDAFDADEVKLMGELAGDLAYGIDVLRQQAERKRAEKALRESEVRYHALFAESVDGILITDIETKTFKYTNPAMCRMLGYTEDELRTMGVPDIHPKDALQSIIAEFEALARGEKTSATDIPCLKKDGSVVHADINSTKITIDGRPCNVGFFRDITERKRVEDALRESQASLEAAQSINRMGNWDLDLAAGTGRWSKEMFRLFNRDPALGALHFNDFLEMVHPEDRKRLMETHQRVIESGEQCQQEFRTNPARGPIHHFATIIQAVKESSGPVRRVAGTVQDITERKLAEERIREQATLLDAANDAIYVRALDHTVTYWNDGAERLFEWTRAEALGRKITGLGDVGHKAFEAAHATLLQQGNWSGELKRKNKAGKEIIIFCRWTLLRDESGRPKEVLAINTDITERKQLEANFLRAQRMEGIGALAGGIAHDLNNILQPILMTAPLLRATTSDPESREMLDTVKNCAQRGADIIKQLLTFARGEPGARVPLPVRHLLNEMSKLIQETFPKNIQLRVNVPKDLWLVLGDATQIHQALMNLCVNARDAMPDGGTLTLMAGNLILDEAFAAMMPSAKPGPHICVSVADTGMGIPPEHLGRIFDPFFTTKEIGKGTGLGLATVLGIARGHGGFVRVNSQAGKGTIFELYLPASSETKAAVSSEHETPPPCAGGELILVVDDEADVRGVIQRTLEKHGYRVLTAAEGTEAMGLFAQHRAEIRAVLTDMMMPDMDGPSLVRALRHLDPQLPIVGMTGVGEKADIKGLETLDLLVLLTKPFNSAVLLGVLHQALAAPRKANGKP
jgi:PAS domain S-box-containing protein